MSSDWTQCRLDKIVEITSSKRVMMADYVTEGVPFYRSKEIIERSKGNYISTELFITEKSYETFRSKFGAPKTGEILLTSVGTLGIPYQVEVGDKFYFKDGNLTWFRNFHESINPDFLYYWLLSPLAQQKIDEISIGSTQKALTISALKTLEIKFPSIAVQKNIVQILRDLDKKLAVNRQTNQTLEQTAQALFKSWFVDFEPTRAKIFAKEAGVSPEEIERAAMCAISGKTPDQLAQLPPETQQNLKTTAALFPDALVDSELGEVPEGWHVSEIGKEVDVVGGGTPSTANTEFWEDGENHWTTPKDMSNLTDKILLETDRKITDAGLKKISSGLLPRNTVLMSSRAPVGYLAIAKIPVAINQGYIAMKCEKILSPEYVVQWAESVMDEIKQRSSGTTFAEISKTNFRLIRTLVPNEKLVQAYTKEASSVYEKITSLLLENRELISIRDSLLPKLLSGSLAIGIDNE